MIQRNIKITVYGNTESDCSDALNEANRLINEGNVCGQGEREDNNSGFYFDIETVEGEES